MKASIAALRRERQHAEPVEEQTPATEPNAKSVLAELTPAEHDALLVETSVEAYEARLKADARDAA